jgi:glycosyltransferase involved in cell wall biosynthesis
VKRLLVFASSDITDPATRIRAYYMAKYLLKKDFDTRVFFFRSVKGNVAKRSLHVFKDFLSKIGAVIETDRKALIYIQRGVDSVPEFSLVFSICSNFVLRKKVIFDIDDSLFLANPFVSARVPHTTINSIIRFSDLIIVGGHELLNYVKKYNKNAFLVPTSVDLGRYLPHNAVHGADGIRLGFVGSPSTNYYLKLILRPLGTLAKSYDFELRVISASSYAKYRQFSSLFDNFKKKGVKLELIPWSLNDEYCQLQNIDVGLAPLINRQWERYKCGFKVINYMGAGIPPVASDVGEHRYIIRDGVNGFLCRDEDEWAHKLRRLIEDEKLRRDIGLNARKAAEETYSMEKNATILARILTDLHKNAQSDC